MSMFGTCVGGCFKGGGSKNRWLQVVSVLLQCCFPFSFEQQPVFWNHPLWNNPLRKSRQMSMCRRGVHARRCTSSNALRYFEIMHIVIWLRYWVMHWGIALSNALRYFARRVMHIVIWRYFEPAQSLASLVDSSYTYLPEKRLDICLRVFLTFCNLSVPRNTRRAHLRPCLFAEDRLPHAHH